MYVTLDLACDSSEAETPEITTASNFRLAQHRSFRLASGRRLFLEGDEAENIYEVKSGLLRLTRVLENGRRQVISFALPGDFVGFPDNGTHHTDCDVIVNAKIVAHRRAALENRSVDPELHGRLLQAALREISAMQDHFMMLSCKSASEKLASFLLVMADRLGRPNGRHRSVELAMRRADIADFLGLTIETVSRTMTQLRKSGAIRLETAHRIVVLDEVALRAAAQPD